MTMWYGVLPAGYGDLGEFGRVPEQCAKLKAERKRLLRLMWQSTIFTKQRRAYEKKANEAARRYRACKKAVKHGGPIPGAKPKPFKPSVPKVLLPPAPEMSPGMPENTFAPVAAGPSPWLIGVAMVGLIGLAFLLPKKGKQAAPPEPFHLGRPTPRRTTSPIKFRKPL